MRTWLLVAAITWPLMLSVTVLARARGDAPLFTSVVYLAASRICHQRPDRSFDTLGVQWPVCGRCSGIYLGAPVGALLTWRGAGRRRNVRGPLLVALVPTAFTLLLEWNGAAMSSVWRAAAALPLGAAVLWAIAGAVPARSGQSGRLTGDDPTRGGDHA